MDFYADVLDHIGKTPREFDAVQAHLESAVRSPSGAVVTLLFQAAFEPCPPPKIAVYAGGDAGELDASCGQFEGPSLLDGAVVRAQFPIGLAAGARRVFIRFEAPLAKGAERIRPAWKLHDTLEMPKLSDMTPSSYSDDVGLNIGDSLFHSAFSGGLVLSVNLGLGSSVVESNGHVKLHKAMELPPGLSGPIEDGDVPGLAAPAFEVIWKPGMPLPSAGASPTWQAAAEGPKPQTRGAVRRCVQCLFEGDATEYERARFCPRCDAIWS